MAVKDDVDVQEEILEWLQHEAEPRTISEIQVGIGSRSSAEVFQEVYNLMIAQKLTQHRLYDRKVGYKAVMRDD